MVVITAFLLKAAYDRYNSNSSEDNISASEHTRNNTNNNNYPTQTLRRINSSPDRLNSYHQQQQQQKRRVNSNTIGNNTTHRIVNGRIYKTRHRSTTSLHRTNSRRYSAAKSNSSYNFRNIMTIETKQKEEEVISTKYGYFVVNPKTKVISLPSEQPPPSTANNNNSTSRSGDNAIMKLDFETPSKTTTNTIIQNNPSIVTENGSSDGRGEKSYTINNSNTTFRNDIRNDWVDAIFGKDFFPLETTNNNVDKEGEGQNNNGLGDGKRREGSVRDDIGIKQGTGAAGISHYVTYGAILDPNSTNSKNNNNGIKPSHSGNSSTATPSSSSRSKVGREVQSNRHKSTPLIFTSPSSSSLLNNTSLVSACGAVTTTPADIINNEEGGEERLGEERQQFGFETPLPNGNGGYGAKYTIEGQLPPPSTSKKSTTNTTPKLGITISRIPIALYVQSINQNSEAYTVGISPGSILVNINGLGMLGERSDRALERVWLYTGLFGTSSGSGGGSSEEGGNNGGAKKNQEGNVKRSKSGTNLNGSSTRTNLSSNSTNNNEYKPQDLQMKKPLLLKFYKSGRTYTTLLLSGKPLVGINWAPVGNFALVHKVSMNSIASDAGVRRGTLVVAVSSGDNSGDNGSRRVVTESLRTLDHSGVARILKDRFSNGVSC